MAGRPSLVPMRTLNTSIEESLLTKVDLILFSEFEGRVPKGAYQRLISRLFREMFDHREMDLSPYLSEPPGEYVIKGSPATLERLRQQLESSHG